jgi:transketolase
VLEEPELMRHPVLAGYIGVQDRFGDSGAPWELVKEFEVSAEHIAHKAAELICARIKSAEAVAK